MSDQGELYENSWILYHIMDRFIGSQELVDVRRKGTVVGDQRGGHLKPFSTGSRAEGMRFPSSDRDCMFIEPSVIVVSPDKEISNLINTVNKSLLIMREADSRPGYVNLEIFRLSCHSLNNPILRSSTVVVGNSNFVSSESFKRLITDTFPSTFENVMSHGPATSFQLRNKYEHTDIDYVISFPCYDWPREANEWVNRPRLHNWPDKALQNQIVQGGCHLVPVGDKTSANFSLQWRISFATAERKLIYSLSHVQFLVYGLLKYFQKQISVTLKQLSGEADVLSSYIIKTAILHAVENTPWSFWQEKNIFLCFIFCMRILISWIKAGHCPNYFIRKNNMFLGKVNSHNQRRLLRYLTDLHDMNWKCLSVGTVIQPSLGERLRDVKNGEWEYVLPPPAHLELERDVDILYTAYWLTRSPVNLPKSLGILTGSKSDIVEFLGYIATVERLSSTGKKIFGEHITARGNKEKYKSLKKCKNLLKPYSTVCTSPGLLSLATFYYQTGNYMKTLEICDHVISSFKFYFSFENGFDADMFEKIFCGRGYSLLQKLQAMHSDIRFTKSTLQFCPSQLRQAIGMKLEIIPQQVLQNLPPQLCQPIKHVFEIPSFPIPPLPYAVFLSFLCYHELGDTRRRDRALIHLQTVKYDEQQGVNQHWIVHTILGICFEMVGDKRSAHREYREFHSRQRQEQDPFFNLIGGGQQLFQNLR